MKTALFIILAVMIISSAAQAKVLISEVIADPIMNESGGEAVELYNTGNEAVDISGFTLATGSSEKDSTLPNGSFIFGHGFFLIADAGWNLQKDNSSWPAADHEEAITIGNSNSGVALRNSSITIDAVGWGDPLLIKEGLFEGSSLPNPKEGGSFERKPGLLFPERGNFIDSDNNSADFISRKTPEPQSTSSKEEDSPSGDALILSITVLQQEMIKSISISDEDMTKEGVQVIPNPGARKILAVAVNSSSGCNLSGRIFSNSIERKINFSDENQTGESFLEYFDFPGEYTAEVSACMGQCENLSIHFYYEPLISVLIDSDSIALPPVSPGSTASLEGDLDFSTIKKPTLWNAGNKNASISISASDFSQGQYIIPASSVKYYFSGSSNDEKPLSTIPTQAVSLFPASKIGLGFSAEIPSDSKEGNYSGIVVIEVSS